MMKWMIFVIMTAMPNQGDYDDIYIFSNPTFNTFEECRAHVLSPQNIPSLSRHLILQYGVRTIQDIKCVPESKVRAFILKEQPA